MKDNNQKNWLLDSLMLTGFLFSFFIELTGLAIHQWMGVAIFLLTMIHLFNHWTWLKNVVSHFSGKMKPRLKIYALMDGLLLIGFVMIILTGLVISTWFDLSIGKYTTWLNLHTYFSIGTLMIAVIKIAWHWRWIVNITKKIFAQSHADLNTIPPSGMTAAISRRQFILLMGVVGLGSALAISNVLPKRQSNQSVSSNDNENDVMMKKITIEGQQPASEQVQSLSTQPATQSSSLPQNTPTATPQVISQPALVCTASCRRGNHCAFPGKCHEYIDTNNNGLCDLGECG